MASKHLIPFARTLQSKERTGKIGMRETALSILIDVIDNTKEKRVRIITLPSMNWLFEKTALQYMYKMERGVKYLTLKCFEYNWDMFCVSALEMPKDLHIPTNVENDGEEDSLLNYQKINSNCKGNMVSLHNVDVFTYLEHKDNMFNFMWLDLTSPIDAVKDRIIHASNQLYPEGILILSFSKGRERIKIDNRIKFTADILTDLELLQSFEYNDTVPMINLIFRKNVKTLTKEDVDILVKKTI